MRSVPRAPAAGNRAGSVADAAPATASAFSAPDARIHTSRAVVIGPNVSEIRTGGGLGESRTATTGRVSPIAGCPGNRDAT